MFYGRLIWPRTCRVRRRHCVVAPRGGKSDRGVPAEPLHLLKRRSRLASRLSKQPRWPLRTGAAHV
eukprot:scaffold203_cov386-Prasinococcus_capsulatus_cf.AAC.19